MSEQTTNVEETPKRVCSVVVGYTDSKNIVLVGTSELTAVTVEVKADETPLDAGKRGFFDATGFMGKYWTALAADQAAHVYGGAECYFFLATGLFLAHQMKNNNVMLLDAKQAQNLLDGFLGDLHLENVMSWVGLSLALRHLTNS